MFSFSSFSEKNDYYFGLFLKENKAVGCILQKKNNTIELLAKEHFVYSDGWEHIAEDVDDVLSRLEKKTNCHVEKTIFFFFSHFIDEKENAIKKPYSIKIKELTKGLSLKPIGYIECNDAISAFISRKDTFPLTTIMVEVDLTNLGVYVYKSGYKKLHKIVSRTDSIIEDILLGLQSPEGPMLLPSRIVLYNSSDLTQEATTILSYRWSGDLFVQTPRVEILNEDDVINSLISIFESQICSKNVTSNHTKEDAEEKEMLGFVLNKDIKDIPTKHILDSQSHSPSIVFKSGIQRFRNYVSQFHTNVFKNDILKASLLKSQYVLLTLSAFFLVVILFSIEFFFHTAQLTLLLPTRTLEKTVTLKGNLDNFIGNSLKVYTSSSSARISASALATGKRDIGEKSKGEVTLYNFDDKEKAITKGTAIQFESLVFETNAEVKVAAASLASDASAKLPGKTKVSVTALVLGPAYNLEKNKRFKVGDFSSSLVFAINESGFTGGTKNSVSTVSKTDLDNIRGVLEEKAKKENQNSQIKLPLNEINVLNSLTEVTLSKITSSKEVGEEGSKVDMNAVADTVYYYVLKKDVKNALKNELSSQAPTNYQLISDKIAYQIKRYQKDRDDYRLVLNATAKAVKTVDITEIANRVKGKMKNETILLLKKEYVLSGVTIDISPHVPLLKDRLPLFEKNITINSEEL